VRRKEARRIGGGGGDRRPAHFSLDSAACATSYVKWVTNRDDDCGQLRLRD